MAITAVDKEKINKYLKEHAVDDIYYLDMCEAIGKKGKISDVEFLEYFTDCVLNEFSKNEKIYIKNLTKIILVIDSFLGWISDEGTKIKEAILEKIRNFPNFYNDYLEKTGFEKDLDFEENSIKVVIDTIDELYPANEKIESASKYISRIAELEKELAKITKELAKITKLYSTAQETLVSKTEKVDLLNKDLVSLENNLANKEKEVTGLNEDLTMFSKLVEDLRKRICDLTKEIETLQTEKEELVMYKDKCEELNDEITRLQNIIDDDIKKQKDACKLNQRNHQIEELIYQKLLFERASVDEIKSFIETYGFETDNTEVLSLLKNVRSKFTVDKNTFSLKPGYRISIPKVLEDGKFKVEVPSNYKCYDIMLVTDFHLKEFSKDVLNGFDKINDYCAKQNINLILNLGDFFDGIGTKALDYDCALANYRLAEEAIETIPKSDGLYHAVLGGNHDRNIHRYGFDPIELLSREREDFIHLGYTHSTISLKGTNSNIGEFDIHHPETFNFPIYLNSEGIDITGVESYLKEIYDVQNRKRKNSYIDIFGHTHKSQLNAPGSYLYLPAFFENGACHLKVYLDEGKIKYMVFMPLDLKRKLVKNNEIVYQKVLKM